MRLLPKWIAPASVLRPEKVCRRGARGTAILAVFGHGRDALAHHGIVKKRQTHHTSFQADTPFTLTAGRGFEYLHTMKKNMRGVVAGIILSAMVMAGCQSRSGRLNTKEAVRQAVEAHLKGNAHLEISNFTTSVESVKFKGDTADALVRFQGKQSPDAAVVVRYKLKKAGDHWEVTSSAPAGGQGMHGDMGTTTAPGPAAPAPGSPAPGSNPHGQLTPEASH
jgi:hypothetical protein